MFSVSLRPTALSVAAGLGVYVKDNERDILQAVAILLFHQCREPRALEAAFRLLHRVNLTPSLLHRLGTDRFLCTILSLTRCYHHPLPR